MSPKVQKIKPFLRVTDPDWILQHSPGIRVFTFIHDGMNLHGDWAINDPPNSKSESKTNAITGGNIWERIISAAVNSFNFN